MIVSPTITKGFVTKEEFRKLLEQKNKSLSFLSLISNYLILLVWLLSHILRTTLVLSLSNSITRLVMLISLF
ncbi:hypothetical protein CRYUN_Cryun20dG0051200 [Craigia yunnanensis]